MRWLSEDMPDPYHITYSAPPTGAERVLPFVVGVIGDVVGNGRRPADGLAFNRFVDIDRGRFDEVIGRNGTTAPPRRGLQDFVRVRASRPLLLFRVLDCTRQGLDLALGKAGEVEHGRAFKTLYEETYGRPDGE